jgi:hypothetical protein
MGRWLKEPLLHFLLIGAGLFVLFYQVADPESLADNRIRIGAADIDRMTVLFERKWQRPPSPKEVDGLIEAQIREEVLYRKALAMGLDEDDTIVAAAWGRKWSFCSTIWRRHPSRRRPNCRPSTKNIRTSSVPPGVPPSITST